MKSRKHQPKPWDRLVEKGPYQGVMAEGRQAALDGKLPNDCPYHGSTGATGKEFAWRNGFNKTRIAMRQGKESL